MTISRAGSSVLLAWDSAASGFKLESSSSFSSHTWGAVTELPTVQGAQNVVTTAIADSARFYRLKK